LTSWNLSTSLTSCAPSLGKSPEEENIFRQREEESNKSSQNQIFLVEPRKITESNIDRTNLQKKNYLFDLNEVPENEGE